MQRPQRLLAALALSCALLSPAAHGVSLTLDGALLDMGEIPVYENTTFVPLRAMIETLYPKAQVSWENGRAVARGEGLDLSARPGEEVLLCNGDAVELSLPVLLESDRTLVPLRPLAALLGIDVTWHAANDRVVLTTLPDVEDDQLYWLSRIISAESQGECWEGKIAVGNVVLNRVRSPDFPDTIYGVIFDDRWGGQFEPVRNGSVYQEPTAESIQAAIACLAGENVAGNSLYFLAPHLTDNHWTMENRTYVTTIGAHWFYE